MLSSLLRCNPSHCPRPPSACLYISPLRSQAAINAEPDNLWRWAPLLYFMPEPSITTIFQVHLDRILAALRGGPVHATGPKKPSLSEQESGVSK